MCCGTTPAWSGWSRPDAAALLDLVVSQPRRYGAAEPDVLARLLSLLREVAWTTRGPAHHAAIVGQLARLRTTIAAQSFDQTECDSLPGSLDWPSGDA